MYIWKKKGQIKLGPGEFVKLQVGDQIPDEILEALGEKNVEQLIASGSIFDATKQKKRQRERLQKAKEQALKASLKKRISTLKKEIKKLKSSDAPQKEIAEQEKLLKQLKGELK